MEGETSSVMTSKSIYSTYKSETSSMRNLKFHIET